MILHQIPWRRAACPELGLRQTSISVSFEYMGRFKYVLYYCSFLCHKELTCNDRIIWGFKVVYHLHGQTARLPWFVQMVSEIHNWSILPRIAFTIFTNPKAWKWYQRWLWRNGTRIPSGKTGQTGLPFSDVPFLVEIFRWSDTKSRVSFTFRIIRKMAPDYLCKLISRRKSTGYSLRSSKKVMLEVPSGKILPTLGGRAFCYAAPKLWNNLPSEISSLDSLSNFKCHVKTYLFKQAFNL